jgi:hypothetical protein
MSVSDILDGKLTEKEVEIKGWLSQQTLKWWSPILK